MSKGRLEAFSDGVIAIIITIMVLELRVPAGAEPSVLIPLIPVFLSYLLSFVFVGIYWNNHHHLLQAAREVNGTVLWANLHLLFWLSLVPFVTNWLGENGFASWPVALYGVVLLMAGFADIERCGAAVAAIIGEGLIPAGLEMMDALAIEAAEDFAGCGYPRGAQALLLCELDGVAEDVAWQSEQVLGLLRSCGALSVSRASFTALSRSFSRVVTFHCTGSC